MRLDRIIILFFVLAATLTTVTAQDTLSYDWAAAGISLDYPANWDDPLPVEQNGQISLQLAQALVDTPAEIRPPAIPTITLTLISGGTVAGSDLTPFLGDALQDLGLDKLDVLSEGLLLDSTAPEQSGFSADDQFFGIARADIIGSDQVLVVVGRAASIQRDGFIQLFDQVTSSISTGDAAVEYGILWHTLDDADEGLLNLIGLTFGPNNRLYTFEQDLGVVEIDSATGDILNITPHENITAPTDIVSDSTGTVYISDIDCGCIYTLTPDGVWLDQAAEVDEDEEELSDAGLMTGFGENAPAHLTVGPDDTLYATDVTSSGTIAVLAFQSGQRRRTIRLDAGIFEQPLLATAPAGQVIALSQFGDLLTLSGISAETLDALGPVASQMTDFALTAEETIVITTADQGIFVLTTAGEFVAQPGLIVPGFPLPGEFVAPTGVTTGPDGTLYFADSDGTFGAITAMSSGVPLNRLGSTSLTAGLAVQGILNEATPQQAWAYSATVGDQITITALDNSSIGALDVALRLLDLDGNEVAFNDDHQSPDLLNFTDAQIARQTLTDAGNYIIRVEQVDGEGSYTLGLSLTRPMQPGADGISSASGQLDFAFPVERWTFSGQAGQTLRITLEPTSSNLDPILRLFGPDNTLIAENDDAADQALGPTSQLVNISLPVDGLYTLEAARFDGAGRYQLTIVSTT